MRPISLLALCSALAWAQSADRTLYTTDINGNRVAAESFDTSKAPDGSTRKELSQSVNGRVVPLEQTEQHVTKQGNRTITETLTTRFDPTGNLSVKERVVTEREDLPGGSSTESSHTYRSDVSGNMKEMERRTVDTRVQGSTITKNSALDRPGLDGAFQTAEKRATETQTVGDRSDTKETVYRRSQNGELYPALQQVTTEVKKGDTTTDQVANYEPGINGNLQLASQTVSTSTTDKAGNETREVNLFAPAAAGRVQENGAPQQIKEQQIITRRVGSDGTVTESLSVRRPSLADPTKLGSLQQVSETVCKGDCKPPVQAKPAPGP